MQLRFQDGSGVWWTIDAENGAFLRFDGQRWVRAEPPRAAPTARKRGSRLIPFVGLIASTSCGLLWTMYTMLRLGQGESADYLTPFIMAGIPITLWMVSGPIDRILAPFQAMRQRLPRPLLLGAALALPIVLGLACTAFDSSGYGGMRWTALLSIVGAHVLTRQPGGRR